MLLQSQKQQSIKLVRFGLGIGLFIPFVSIFSSITFALNSYLVIAPKFDEAGYFQKGLAKIKIGDKYGYIDKTGKVVVPFKSEEADSIKLRPAKVGAEYGYVDKTGNTVIPPQFREASEFYEGLAKVEISYNYKSDYSGIYIGKIVYIDKTGKIVIPPRFDRYYGDKKDIGNFHEGLASVNIDDKWGYIDKTGKIVIPLQFNEVGNFHEGLAGVEIGGKWGYIDKTGKIVVPPEFETKDELEAKSDERKAKFKEAESLKEGLKEGLKPVKMGRKYGYIRNPLK